MGLTHLIKFSCRFGIRSRIPLEIKLGAADASNLHKLAVLNIFFGEAPGAAVLRAS